LGQAFAERLVDEVAWYVAPRLCGAAGLSVLGQQPLAASVQLKDVQITPLGDNLCLTGRPKWAEAAALPPP
jgi:diaminohydroxyphosphoribosylaminopyrimidine deaminase/5-amino-6-(5-phosphoribosylamino)uracil reductase